MDEFKLRNIDLMVDCNPFHKTMSVYLLPDKDLIVTLGGQKAVFYNMQGKVILEYTLDEMEPVDDDVIVNTLDEEWSIKGLGYAVAQAMMEACDVLDSIYGTDDDGEETDTEH